VVDCQVEDVQAPSGDDDVSRMSVITVESASPPESVHSINSSADDVDDYMVDVDADVEEAASDDSGAVDEKFPVVDVIHSSNITEDLAAEANVPESSENLCISEIAGKGVIDDADEFDSSVCKTATTAPENVKENSVTVNGVPCFPITGSSDKCNGGMETASETTSALESGIVSWLFEVD